MLARTASQKSKKLLFLILSCYEGTCLKIKCSTLFNFFKLFICFYIIIKSYYPILYNYGSMIVFIFFIFLLSID